MNAFSRPFLEAAFSLYGLTTADAKRIKKQDAEGFEAVNKALRSAYFSHRGVFTYSDLAKLLGVTSTRVRIAFEDKSAGGWKRRNEAKERARKIAAEAIRAAVGRPETFPEPEDSLNALVLQELNRIAEGLKK